jgi:hypothetical protein
MEHEGRLRWQKSAAGPYPERGKKVYLKVETDESRPHILTTF